ncbi:unnamed protein product [Spirodela intermedia]|uniref:Uncharacterized protein n=1 Tax=Spirodela intermedia TaxID=51605 RepID=A0A7I8L7W8_SPIIN|nr:unnamed protein product [Spirodela intermedia]
METGGALLPPSPAAAASAGEEGPERWRRQSSEEERRNAAGISGEAAVVVEESGRERLKRHRVAMGGSVWIPERWGKEELLKDWIDCAAVDRALVPAGLTSAREALVEERQRVDSVVFPAESQCLTAWAT